MACTMGQIEKVANGYKVRCSCGWAITEEVSTIEAANYYLGAEIKDHLIAPVAPLAGDALLNAVRSHLAAGGRVVVGNHYFGARHAGQFRISPNGEPGLYVGAGKRAAYAFPSAFHFVA